MNCDCYFYCIAVVAVVLYFAIVVIVLFFVVWWWWLWVMILMLLCYGCELCWLCYCAVAIICGMVVVVLLWPCVAMAVLWHYNAVVDCGSVALSECSGVLLLCCGGCVIVVMWALWIVWQSCGSGDVA